MIPDYVGELVSSTPDSYHAVNFSTYSNPGTNNVQRTLVEITNATFLAALENVLGALSGGEKYQINSATLTVGSVADNYATTGNAGAYRVLVPWDSSDVTWNEADADANVAWSAPGLAAGVDYFATSVDTGAVGTYTTVWSGLGSTVQDWLDGTDTNYGLFFPDPGGSGGVDYTAVENVSWTLDASIVPAPSALVLLGTGGLVLVLGLRRRKRSKV